MNEKEVVSEKEVYRTWDTWCLIKLRELGRSTQKQWAHAMGDKHPASISGMIKNNTDKLIITLSPSGRYKFYEVRKDVKL